MKIFIKFFIFLLVLVFIPLSFLESAKAIPIGPDKYFFDLNKNEVKEETLFIYGRENLEEVQKVFLYTVGMKKVGEENNREFYKVDPNNFTEIANWIDLDKSEVLLKKGDVIEVKWKISPKGDAPCGTNLAAIVAATAPLDNLVNGNKVNVKNEVISQVHVNIVQSKGIPCEINLNQTRLVEFKVNNYWNIFDHQEVPFLTRIENDSSYIVRSPLGFIEIYQGDKKLDSIEFNKEKLDLYPKTIRKFENNWLDPDFPKDSNYFNQLWYELGHFKIGKYQAKLGVSKNISPQIIATTDFWIIPWRTIIAILTIILFFVLLYFVNRSNSRKSNTKNDKLKLR